MVAGPRGRMDWAKGLDFPVPVVGEDVEDLTRSSTCSGSAARERTTTRPRKTSRAVVELLRTAGVMYTVLGNGETCTGDPARRAGNGVRVPATGAGERRDADRGQGDQVVTAARTASTR